MKKLISSKKTVNSLETHFSEQMKQDENNSKKLGKRHRSDIETLPDSPTD